MSETTFNLDAKATDLLESFAKNGSASGLSFAEARDKNKRAVRLDITCEASGDLLVSDYGHSVLCKIISSDDLSKLEAIEDAAVSMLPEGIDFKPFVKDEKFFMKLPHKNDKYRAAIDPSFLPSQTDKAPFHQGSEIQIESSVSVWINFDNKQAGLFLNIFKITVDGGKKKSVRRR
jgi:hypothetical protein